MWRASAKTYFSTLLSSRSSFLNKRTVTTVARQLAQQPISTDHFGTCRANNILSSHSNVSFHSAPITISDVTLDLDSHHHGIVVNWGAAVTPPSLFHHGWLYRTCSCEHCKQPHSGQLLRDPQDLPVNPVPKRVWLEGSNIHIEWIDTRPNHASQYALSFLFEHRYDDHVVAQRRVRAMPKPLLAQQKDVPVPIMNFEEVMQTEKGLCDWLNILADSGACVISDAPTQHNTVVALSQKIGQPMQTIYGKTWQVRADDVPINIAYSTVGLNLHMDLVYYESPPALQFLHCLRFDPGVTGGENTLMDYFAAAEQLRATNPSAFHTLCELPATFQKIHSQREHPVHLVSRRPHIWIDPETEDVIGGIWAPPFEGPPLLPASKMEQFMHAYLAFAAIIEDPYSPLRLEIKLQPGDILTFSNRRMLHGRTAFVQQPGAVRHLEGCYVSVEDFVNSLQRTTLKSRGSTSHVGLMLGSHLP